MDYIILGNGLKVLLHAMPNTHSVTFGLYLRAGQAYVEPFPGITHLLEHLYFRQMGTLTQRELYYRMESIGSTLRAVTYRNLLAFSMKVATCYFSECLQFFVNMLNVNNWSEENFLKEKNVVLNQIIEKEEYAFLEKVVRGVIFKDHPLSLEIMGTSEQVEKISLADITSYRNELFTCANMLVCVTGNFSQENVDQLISELCQCRIMSGEKLQIKRPTFFHRRKPDIILSHEPNMELMEANMSFDISYTKDIIDYLLIVNCILGEGVGSRLQKKIREDLCYCSDIGSHIEWYSEFAVLHIRFSVIKSKLLPCIEAVIDTINEIKASVTKQDMDVSLPFYTTNLIFSEDDTEEMNFQQAYHHMVLDSTYRPTTVPNNRTSAKKIQVLANTIFRCQNCCLSIIGNTKGVTHKSIRCIVSKLNL